MEKIKLTIVSLTLNEVGGGKRDILIKFKRQNEIYSQTSLCENAGKNPIWNEEFQLNESDELVFYIYEKDPLSEDLIAESELI